MSTSDWPQLPDVLLEDIMRRITKHSTKVRDVVGFQFACEPWRQVAAVLAQENNQPPGKFRQSLPWLMRRCDSQDCERPSCHQFIDVTPAAAGENNKGLVVPRRHIDVGGDNPLISGHLSSALGWLLRATKQQHSLLYLLNPFTGNQIPLPYLPASEGGWGVQAFAMSAEPTEEGCIVMICSVRDGSRRGALAFCKIGDLQWRFVPTEDDDEQCKLGWVMDLVFWRGKFHGVCKGGDILVCDLFSGLTWPYVAGCFWDGEPFRKNHHTCYLLAGFPQELEDYLMLVVRSYNVDDIDRSVPFIFQVYLINVDRKMSGELTSIGDYALFADDHKVTYASVKDHPECHRNCVYHPKGIFDLDRKRMFDDPKKLFDVYHKRVSGPHILKAILDFKVHERDASFDFIDDHHQLVPTGWILPSNY